ncbi:hypothetical protein [Streptomyces sp. NRRL F-4489]|uniref:hypothetical protein n=1 Tax=Streptomyces sp. NRRL F-4489 TaxID=1609095 RepID=UPI00099ED586|nr:hypothetical protein [Streptomyces sp. NRRL F-4489]
MHSGGGHQFNFSIWVIGADERWLRAGDTRLSIVREHRIQLARCFIPPRNYGKAAERLEAAGAVVLLDGPPGSGRRAAATMLLERAAVPGSRIEELPVRWEEDSLDASADDRYLLDLSGVSDADFAAAQVSLQRYRAIMEQSGARLVAVLPAGLDWMLEGGLTPLVVRLERPRGRAVFRRYLRVRKVAFEPEQLETDHLGRLFATAPVRELARLADLVVQARDSRRYGTTFAAWRDEAVAAIADASDQVARHLREHRGGLDRALLLTAAMVSGAAAEAVLSGAHGLLDILGHEQDETPRLAQADLSEQLTALSIERKSDGSVEFPQLAYDDAVRRHFWRNFPDLRPAFRDWVGRCMELPELTGQDRMRLVARFAEQALDSGRPDDLCVLAERWTDRPVGGRLRPEAAAALESGLSDDRHGAHLRARIYGWVTAGTLAPDLVRVLTDVCHQVLAVTHPDQAMVRLRHLALRQKGEGAAAARAALLDVARGNRRVFRRLTDRLADAGRSALPNVDILLELLDPVPLRITPPWNSFTLGWRTVMTMRPVAVWTPLVQRWLSVAAEDSAGEQVINGLLLAAAGDDALLTHLYAATCAWAEGPLSEAVGTGPTRSPHRERLAARVWQKIDLLQGVEGPVPGPGGQRTGVYV